MAIKGVALGLVTTCVASTASAVDLDGTIFSHAAQAHGLDTLLVYSVALAESASGRGNGSIGPWPWTLRAPGQPVYTASERQAEEALTQLQQQHGGAIDVGLMQVNIRWNGHRVASPADLLDPATNVMVGATILAEAIQSSPSDLELGIGRYHAWEDEARARNYGSRVLAIYRNLHEL